MFRRVADFQKAWEQERASTLKVLGALTDALARPGGREGRPHPRAPGLARHDHPGRDDGADGPRGGRPVPRRAAARTAAAIASAYEAASKAVASGVAAWTDATLEVEDEMYGEKWPRG